MSEEVRRALARLAGDDVIARAEDATTSVAAAAAFVGGVGLPALRAAVERAERSGADERARRGREALDALERCRAAARDHFHPGHDTHLSGGAEGSGR